MEPFYFDELARLAVQNNCRELHLTVGAPVGVVLNDGTFVRLETRQLIDEDTMAMMTSITPKAHRRRLANEQSIEFGLFCPDALRFHISLSMTGCSVSIIARLAES